MDDQECRADRGYIGINGLTVFPSLNGRTSIVYNMKSPADLNALIDWRLGDKYYQAYATRLWSGKQELNMQRQWTIEARADFTDEGKYELINEEVRRAGVVLQAKLDLIMENGIKPKVACGSDDWFMGHKEIDMLSAQVPHGAMDSDMEAVSAELLDAAKDAANERKKT